MALSRRRFSQAATLLPLAWATVPAGAGGASSQATVLAAAWQLEGRFRVGWLALRPGQPVTEIAAVDVPTRAHHVSVDSAGRLLAVARRPGDWLLRWARPASPPQWRWIEAARSFNGHVLTRHQGDRGRRQSGGRVFTTETDLESGAGLVGVRDALTLAKLDEWPTGGADPHQLLSDSESESAQALYIANGGITTRPETGRAKHGLERMDSSLVRLDARTGRVTGQWRLGDARLSLRHLAWFHDLHGGRGGQRQGARLGVALQAEHDAAEARAGAPVLAIFDGRELLAAAAPDPVTVALAGYGGDIVASADGFIVSCPRAGGLAHFDAQGGWQAFTPLAQACALARAAQGSAIAGGDPRGNWVGQATVDRASTFDLGPLRLDNHWTWASRSAPLQPG